MHEFMRGHTVRQLQCDLSPKRAAEITEKDVPFGLFQRII